MKWLSLLLLGVVPVGCTKPNPALSCEDGVCSDPAVPYCDVDGTLGGEEPNACISVSCSPNRFVQCRGDRAVTCNATGDNYDVVSCPYGCGDSGCNACNTAACTTHIIPRYVPAECNEFAAQAALTVSTDTTIDTGNELMCTSTVAQTEGPEVCVLHFGTVSVAAGNTLTVKGPRALALIADTMLTVDGTIDANGASGNAAGGGTRVSGGTANNTKAGGGAGYRTAGGHGAAAVGDGGALNGGAAFANPSTQTALLGGPRTPTANNGGGAITIIACRGEVSVSGVIDVGGGGGRGSRTVSQQGGGPKYAEGGGAGGTVVVQGVSVTITGQLFANGGGGGGGNSSTMNPYAEAGAAGGRSTDPAMGGDAATSVRGGFGGTGAAGMFPGNGASNGTDKGGAGGGAAGYLLTYTLGGTSASINPSLVSPPLEANGSLTSN